MAGIVALMDDDNLHFKFYLVPVRSFEELPNYGVKMNSEMVYGLLRQLLECPKYGKVNESSEATLAVKSYEDGMYASIVMSHGFENGLFLGGTDNIGYVKNMGQRMDADLLRDMIAKMQPLAQK
jgi:hypothetical protein